MNEVSRDIEIDERVCGEAESLNKVLLRFRCEGVGDEWRRGRCADSIELDVVSKSYLKDLERDVQDVNLENVNESSI